MPGPISVLSPTKTSKVYTNSDGTVFMFSGGSIAWRNNNPGNLVYGNTVVIKSIGENGQIYYTLYAHQNGNSMPPLGATVSQGDIIGEVGNTGFWTNRREMFSNSTVALGRRGLAEMGCVNNLIEIRRVA